MTTRTMTLQLIHGRSDPLAAMPHWGIDAEPIQGVAFLHGTYLSNFTVGFASEVAFTTAMLQTDWKPFDELILEVSRYGELIVCGGMFYGDFEFYVGP